MNTYIWEEMPIRGFGESRLGASCGDEVLQKPTVQVTLVEKRTVPFKLVRVEPLLVLRSDRLGEDPELWRLPGLQTGIRYLCSYELWTAINSLRSGKDKK